MLDSAITRIAEGRLYYRGVDAIVLARSATLEETARLLWDCGETDPFDKEPPEPHGLWAELLPRLGGFTPVERCTALLALGEPAALALWSRRSASLWRDGGKLVREIAAAAAGVMPSAEPVMRCWRGPGASRRPPSRSGRRWSCAPITNSMPRPSRCAASLRPAHRCRQRWSADWRHLAGRSTAGPPRAARRCSTRSTGRARSRR
ncbi:MAG: hypothetical protein WDN69_03560 [Aliidongia sp.]